MKKFLLFFAAFIGLLIILWFIGTATNTFRLYTNPSGANEPTLKEGSSFFISILKKPKLHDFICVHAELPVVGKYIGVYRLCAMEGDIVQIKNGDLYVNNNSIDQYFNLVQEYSIAVHDFAPYMDDVTSTLNKSQDSVHVSLTRQFIADNKINATRLIFSAEDRDETIEKMFGRPWNKDQFGPITVPAGCYFVLGDNRNASGDSRYQGFFSKDKFVGTALWK